MTLKLNGQEFVLHEVPAAVQRVKEVLTAAPEDEIFTARELATRFGLMERTLARAAIVYPELTRMCRLDKTSKRVWGNVTAIAEFDRRMSE